MSRILIVDDAPDVQLIVKASLGRDCVVTAAQSAAEAYEILGKSKFDLILLDVTLPDDDGFKFCVTLKNSGALRDIPIIFLSGKSEVVDKVMGLSLGASDYITKPFSPVELRARVEARLREVGGEKNREEVFEKHELRFLPAVQRVFVFENGKETELGLTPIEFKLLLHLTKHSDQIFTRDQLIDAVWGNQTYVVDRTIDVHISNLRKKLVKSRSLIVAIHGTGYRFDRKTEDSV
jgi:DNA-binding response OmpR family regulator